MTDTLYFRLFYGLLIYLLPFTSSAQQAPNWGWVNYFGETSYTDAGENTVAGVGRDALGNLYIAGSYVGAPFVGGIPITTLGDAEAYLAKYAPSGNLLWVKTLHGTGADAVSSLVVEPNGRCTISGTFGFGRSGGNPTFGNLSFSEFNSPQILPGPAQLGLPNYGTVAQPSFDSLPFLASIEPNGTLAWAVCPSPRYGLDGADLARDPQGNIYLSGTAEGGMNVNGVFYANYGTQDAVLWKFDAAGQVQWVRQAGLVSKRLNAPAVKTDQAGAVYWMLSHTSSFVFDQYVLGNGSGSTIIKLSANNHVRWTKNNLVQANGQPAYIQLVGIEAATGTLYGNVQGAGGSTLSFTGAGSPVALPVATTYTQCIVQCDSAGQVNWVKPLIGMTKQPAGIISYPTVEQLLPTSDGFVVLTGTMVNGQTTFTGSPTVYGVGQDGLICVLRYHTASGQIQWTRVGGAAYNQLYRSTRAEHMTADALGNVYVAGTYAMTSVFGATTLPATGNYPHIFFAKLDQSILPTKAAVAGKPWRAYPNPARSVAQLEGLPLRTTVRVLDALGRVARTTQAATLDLSGLAPGLYLLQAIGTAEPYQPQRLLVE